MSVKIITYLKGDKKMNKKFIVILLISIIAFSGISVQTTFADDLETSLEETPSGIPFSKLEKTIDEYVANYIGKTTPGAAVGIVKDGKIVFLKGYGYADIEKQIPVDPKNTVFEWASTSKLFTWASIMQLVEQNKLDLNVDIKKYLPVEFAQKLEYKQPITMRDIMNHSAGFGDYAFNTIVFSPEQVVSLEEAILRDKPKQYYEVGTASSYSNYTASLAGYIVQNISDIPYEDYVRENIFNTLSMKNTSAYPTFDDNKKMKDEKAMGYIPDQKGGFTPGKWSYVSHLPAGAINGTLEDFSKFAIALTPKDDEELTLFENKNTINTMLSPSYDLDGEMVGTAHGFFQYTTEKPSFGHGGNTAAFSSQFAVVPEERFGIVILTNAYLEMNILFGLQDLILGNQIDEATVPDIELPSTSEVEGKYVPMERQEGNFVDFAKYISLYEIKSEGPNKITMNIGPYEGTYLQTEPYHYEIIEDKIPLFRNAYPVLRFRIEDDDVKQIIVGNGMDLSSLPSGRTVPFLTGSIIILIVNILFFTILPIILLISLIKGRKKKLDSFNKRYKLYYYLLVLFGTVTIINNLIPPAKIMISTFHTFTAMKPHIILNYPLFLGTLVTLILSTKYLYKARVSNKTKLLHFATIVLLVLLFVLLFHWNFFAITG